MDFKTGTSLGLLKRRMLIMSTFSSSKNLNFSPDQWWMQIWEYILKTNVFVIFKVTTIWEANVCSGQFHQNHRSGFFRTKVFFVQLFCAYILGLYFLVWKYRDKSCSYNVGEIDSRAQFHQHSTATKAASRFTLILLTHIV